MSGDLKSSRNCNSQFGTLNNLFQKGMIEPVTGKKLTNRQMLREVSWPEFLALSEACSMSNRMLRVAAAETQRSVRWRRSLRRLARSVVYTTFFYWLLIHLELHLCVPSRFYFLFFIFCCSCLFFVVLSSVVFSLPLRRNVITFLLTRGHHSISLSEKTFMQLAEGYGITFMPYGMRETPLSVGRGSEIPLVP